MADDTAEQLAEAAGADLAASEGRVSLNRRALAAFVVTTCIVIAVLAMLPIALESMYTGLRGQAVDRVYDLFTGAEIDPNRLIGPDTAFVNITATQLDETSRMATFIVSGHRVCPAVCPATTATFYAIGNETARRQGLPPSAAVTVPGKSGPFTFTIQLPVQGTPQRYPFDDYTLLLGMTATGTLPDGTEQNVDAPQLRQRDIALTLEDRVARLNMRPPVAVEPASVRSPSDPAAFLLVDRLQWERPRYLRILTVLLVILISASGIFALGMRTLHELVLGIGGIILGVWGVRSVVVQSSLPDATLIDLVLALVMLFLMLALAARAARYFYVQSGLGRRG